MADVHVRVPGKVNLALHAGIPDEDGYHPLATVFHAVSLYDDVWVDDTDIGGIELSFTGEGANLLPVGPDNLVHRAAVLMAERAGIADPSLRIRVDKGIPVAGGMAGGSADAAATLVATDALWNVGSTREELQELGRALGADVPFCLHGGTALGTGRGDVLTPVLARGEFHWVMAFADRGLSTPAVFAELDRLRGERVLPMPRVEDDFMAALRSGDARALGTQLTNDLQEPALSLAPELRRVLDSAWGAGALGAVVSGSGPTCAVLAQDAEHALDLAVTLAAEGVCRTVRTARGPVPGARIVKS